MTLWVFQVKRQMDVHILPNLQFGGIQGVLHNLTQKHPSGILINGTAFQHLESFLARDVEAEVHQFGASSRTIK